MAESEVKIITCAVDSRNYAFITFTQGYYGVSVRMEGDGGEQRCRAYFPDLADAFGLFYEYALLLVPKLEGETNV
jgi:hypothetical protein